MRKTNYLLLLGVSLLACIPLRAQKILEMSVTTELETPIPMDPSLSIQEVHNILDDKELCPNVHLKLEQPEKAYKARVTIYNRDNELVRQEELRLDGKRNAKDIKVSQDNKSYLLCLGKYKKMSQIKIEIAILDKRGEVKCQDSYSNIGEAKERYIEKQEREKREKAQLSEK